MFLPSCRSCVVMHNIHNTEPNCYSMQKLARFDFCLVGFYRKPGFIHPDNIQMNILKPTVSGPCKNLLILPKNLPKDSTADLRERRLTYQLLQKSWKNLGWVRVRKKPGCFGSFLKEASLERVCHGCLVHCFNIAN